MIYEKSNYTPLADGEKIRIVFLFQIPSFWPSWDSFYHACLNDDRFDVKLLWHNENALQDFQMTTAEPFLFDNAIKHELFDQKLAISFAPHVVVIQSPYDSWHRKDTTISLRFKQAGARIVYVPYGLEISDMEESKLLHFYQYTILNAWRIYTFSEAMRQDYVKHCPNRGAVRVTGHPKFDAYANSCDFKLPEEIISSAEGRKILLWKMHFPVLKWDGKKNIIVTPLIDEYIRFAEWLVDCPDMFFVFMPHPMIMSGGVPEIFQEQTAKLVAILKSALNVYIDISDDYRNVLINADAIIVDRSALMVEAAVNKVPILYMHNPDNTERLTNAITPLIESYYQGTTADDMIQFVEIFKSGIDPKRKQREEAFQECVPYTDGKCGVRIMDDIANSILQEQPSAVLRVAVFAMGDVFRYYWEMTGTLTRDDIEIVVISDNNPLKWGDIFHGIPVVEPSNLRNYDFDVIVVFSEQFFKEIFKQLMYEINIDIEKIMRLDTFIVSLSDNEGDA